MIDLLEAVSLTCTGRRLTGKEAALNDRLDALEREVAASGRAPARFVEANFFDEMSTPTPGPRRKVSRNAQHLAVRGDPVHKIGVRPVRPREVYAESNGGAMRYRRMRSKAAARGSFRARARFPSSPRDQGIDRLYDGRRAGNNTPSRGWKKPGGIGLQEHEIRRGEGESSALVVGGTDEQFITARSAASFSAGSYLLAGFPSGCQ
jgi:hypothetical protein